MPAERVPPRRGGIVLGAVALSAVVVLVAIVLLVRGGGGDADPVADGGLTATPVASASVPEAQAPGSDPAAPAAVPGPTDPPTTAPTPTASANPVPAEATASEGPIEGDGPTEDDGSSGGGEGIDGDLDVETAIAAFTPEGAQEVQNLLGDLDGDGDDEVVIASRLGDRSRVDLLDSVDGAYVVVFTGEGGSATAITDLTVADLDGDPDTLEVVLTQTSGTEGESASLWGLRGGVWTPLAAVGGCWDGSHTFGIVGVEVAPQRITATCDGSPDPIVSWPSDVYVWDDVLEAFALDSTIQP